MDINLIMSTLFKDVAAQRVERGMNNLNYRLFSRIDKNPIGFLTLYPDREKWWKVKKNRRIADLLVKACIPTASTLDYGIFSVENQRYAFLLRSLLDGNDIDALVQQAVFASPYWQSILREFAQALGKMHTITLPAFGRIKGKSICGSSYHMAPASMSWVDYMDTFVKDIGYFLEATHHDITYCDISTSDLRRLFPEIAAFYLRHRDVLLEVRTPQLIHNDMHLDNVMIAQRNGKWKLQGIVDLESCLAGDPDFDLIQFENWLQLAPYLTEIVRYKEHFLSAYIEERKPSNSFERKRRLYHVIHSLRFLNTAFCRADPEIFNGNPRIAWKVEHNFRLLLAVLNNSRDFIEIF